MQSAQPFHWKLSGILILLGLLGVAASLPMVLELVDRLVPANEQQEIRSNLPLPIPVLIGAALLQNTVILGGAVAVGMILSRRLGTGAPLLEAWLKGGRRPFFWRILLHPAIVGLLLGCLLAVTDAMVFLPRVPPVLGDLGREIPLWKRLLAGFLYGGITEELIMRWFLLSLVAWSLGRMWRSGQGLPSRGTFWAANIIVAILFALGHLPATQAVTPLTTMVVARSLVLNGLASLTFGHLFWRRGVEAAMVAHACAHLGLQLLGPTLAFANGPDSP